MNYTGDIKTPTAEAPPNARELMTRNEPYLKPGTEVLEALSFLMKNKLLGAPVVDASGKLLGMLTEKDCLRLVAKKAYYHQEPTHQVSEYMTTEVTTADEDMDFFSLVDIFLTKPFRKVPVTKDGIVVGQVSRRDVLRGAMKYLKIK